MSLFASPSCTCTNNGISLVWCFRHIRETVHRVPFSTLNPMNFAFFYLNNLATLLIFIYWLVLIDARHASAKQINFQAGVDPLMIDFPERKTSMNACVGGNQFG